MDKCSSDADFDSYWEYESRNKNRNRIRVGRQYQASVPPLLKPGEKDTRRCEDLETLKWKPDKLSDQCVDQYLSMAKAISRFARAIDPSLVPEKAIDTPMQTALKGLSEFVTSHHPCHHDDGCQVPNPQLSGECSTKHSSSSEWTPNEAQLFAQALEVCGKNFCAIKKDFLPWKPVRSLIEYYYQGKSEKPESPNPTETSKEDMDSKVEKLEPVPSCSEDSPKEVLQPKCETKEVIEACSTECKTEVVTEEVVSCSQSLKVEESEKKLEEMKTNDSSTIGSLKFYLGGRLVLKLNAQQFSESGSKCHWVPSNDTPKRPQLIKRVKHKKKMYQESSSLGCQQVYRNKQENPSWDSSDVAECDVVIAKKAKLKSDCESCSEPETSCPLLYSTSWTPPVANGPDVVEMDDGSSKTSEGCISPVQANSLVETSEIKCEVSSSALNSSAAAGNFCDPSEVKLQQHERVRVKTEPFSSACPASQSETCANDGNIVQGAHLKSEKCLVGQLRDASFNQDVPNNQKCTKNVCTADTNNSCFLPRSAVSCSPSKKHWYKWAGSPCSDSYESSKVHSPNSISQTSVSRTTADDSPLDLSSKNENILQENVVQNPVPASKVITPNFQSEKACPSPLKEEVSLCNKTSECGLNTVSMSSSDSLPADEDTKVRTCTVEAEGKISVSESASGEKNEKCTSNDGNMSSLPDKNVDEKSKSSTDFSYPYYNIPCSCSSPKCTSSFALKEHMCNNKDGIECLKSHSDYLLPVTNRTASGKPPPWFEASVATYLQYYPQCYPYYVAYGVAPSSVTGSSVAELPLDLSSTTCENSKEENVPEKETSVTPNSAEALEKGMLYHLLKSRNSK